MGRKKLALEQTVEVKYTNRGKNGVYHTHTGHKISAKEEKFIRCIMEGKSQRQAYKEAFKPASDNNLDFMAGRVINTPKIAEELEYRFEMAKNDSIATATEIMEYFTRVMRGEERDQFGLDAPLGERTSAAKELMKRVVELEEKAHTSAAPEVKITLSFDRDGEETE